MFLEQFRCVCPAHRGPNKMGPRRRMGMQSGARLRSTSRRGATPRRRYFLKGARRRRGSPERIKTTPKPTRVWSDPPAAQELFAHASPDAVGTSRIGAIIMLEGGRKAVVGGRPIALFVAWLGLRRLAGRSHLARGGESRSSAAHRVAMRYLGAADAWNVPFRSERAWVRAGGVQLLTASTHGRIGGGGRPGGGLPTPFEQGVCCFRA